MNEKSKEVDLSPTKDPVKEGEHVHECPECGMVNWEPLDHGINECFDCGEVFDAFVGVSDAS